MPRVIIFILVVETVLLLGMSIFLFQSTSSAINLPEVNRSGLLSPRIYEKIIEPQSFLIVNYAPLRKNLESYIHEQNGTIGVYLVNLRDGASMSINSQQGFIPGSLGKVPVAILIMKEVEEGKLSLDTLITIQDSDRVMYSSTLYNTTQKQFPLHVLIEKMLQESDNTAFKVLLRYIQAEDYLFLNTYFGFFTDENAGGSLITPRSVYNVFLSLYLSTVLEPEHSEYLLGLLTDTVFDLGKAAQIPSDVRIAQKYSLWDQGNTTVFHSCGIIYPNEMKVFFCVMTQGFTHTDGVKHTGFIVHEIYEYTIETRKQLDGFK